MIRIGQRHKKYIFTKNEMSQFGIKSFIGKNEMKKGSN
ncbi:hypothetical protein LEP1GSC133_5117 [Leptospira borgpetersenii serovar Pomona str. 200901868]|uniref:Uncharacterized protein n=1 Tax=Leptospira borgpetersenii serovar Pomona str. 200901868 TaxID=1192866 RepID=M6WGR0_LEPBO|nr:hypothetical protein LEP1GSC133_5117 [Leptospira borgpetersenii serovar Pomona str. 200901868]